MLRVQSFFFFLSSLDFFFPPISLNCNQRKIVCAIFRAKVVRLGYKQWFSAAKHPEYAIAVSEVSVLCQEN